MTLQPDLIPVFDPNPLPAPYWVFKLLLIVTFFLHILAMNFMLGGAVLALMSKWPSRRYEDGNRVFFDIAKKLPVFLPATISLGIAPLLFVQVLYGQFFYTSSIVMAWPWFLVLVLLTLAYYGFYFVSFHSRQHPGRAGVVMLVSVILVSIIGFVYSNNLTLSQVPARWGAKYFASPSGWHLNLSEPTLIPSLSALFRRRYSRGRTAVRLCIPGELEPRSRVCSPAITVWWQSFYVRHHGAISRGSLVPGQSSTRIAPDVYRQKVLWRRQFCLQEFSAQSPPSLSCPKPCEKRTSAQPPTWCPLSSPS